MSEKEMAVLREMASHDLDAALKYAYSLGAVDTKRKQAQATELVEAMMGLSDEHFNVIANAVSYTAMVENAAREHEKGATS